MKFSNQPVAWSAAIKAVLLALVLLHIVTWTDVQVAGLVAVADAVLGLIVWSNVTPTAKVVEQQRTAAVNATLQAETQAQAAAHLARKAALADVASLAPLPEPPAAAMKPPARKRAPAKKAAAKRG
jgi:hypothetical protein